MYSDLVHESIKVLGIFASALVKCLVCEGIVFIQVKGICVLWFIIVHFRYHYFMLGFVFLEKVQLDLCGCSCSLDEKKMPDTSTVLLRQWGLMEGFPKGNCYLLILRKLQKLNASVSQYLLFHCLLCIFGMN